MKTSEISAAVLRREISELVDRRGQPRTSGAWAKTRVINRKYVNKRGDSSTRRAIERLLSSGERKIREQLKAHEITFPTNWGGDRLVHTVDGGQSWHGWRTLEPEIFEDAARRGGWMKAMGELIHEHPHWFKAMAKAVAKSPERGIGSPRNKGAYSLSQFFTGDSVARWKTPGRAYRAVSHGIRRAKEILSGFEISHIPWKVVVDELGAKRGPTRGNKLGQRFALQTLSHITGVPVKNRATSFEQFKGFRYSAWLELDPGYRAFYRTKLEEGCLLEKIPSPRQRVDDEVTLIYNTEPTIVSGHRVLEGITGSSSTPNQRKWEEVWKMTLVVSPDGRTFHLDWCPSTLHNQPVRIEKINASVYSLNGYTRWPSGYTMYTPMSDNWEIKTVTRTERYWQRFAIRIAQKAWAIEDSEKKKRALQRQEREKEKYRVRNVHPII